MQLNTGFDIPNPKKVSNQTENPKNFIEWVNALEAYECRECGYDFTDTTLKKGHLGLKNDKISIQKIPKCKLIKD